MADARGRKGSTGFVFIEGMTPEKNLSGCTIFTALGVVERRT